MTAYFLFLLCVLMFTGLKKDGKKTDSEGGASNSTDIQKDDVDQPKGPAKLNDTPTPTTDIQKDDVDHLKRPAKLNETPAPTTDSNVLQERINQEDKQPTTFKYPWEGGQLKSLLLDLKAFQKLDNSASKELAHGTLEILLKELLCNCSSELEKTRVIWIWICHHIEYDTTAVKNKVMQPSDPEHIFRSRKGVCAGYTSLFQRMCSIAGVQCKSVNGYSKGAGYKAGQRISGDPTHAWNMVYLEERWHLVDATWGAGHVDENLCKFTFQYNEFYFLTHPALFIEDHFPKKADLQLLEPPLSLERFERNVHRRSHFYSMGLKSSQPDAAVIETVKGKVSVTIESSHRMQFLFHLNETEEPGLMRIKGEDTILDIYPKKRGQNVLQIFSKAPDSDGAYHLIVDYRVDCKSVDTAIKIPKYLNNPVGPSWISEKVGLLQPSHSDPIIHTDDGRCVISFSLHRLCKLAANLKSDEIKNMQNHVIQKVQGLKIEFDVRLPQSGFYVLQIFGEPTGYICNYLLICSNPNVKWFPFPDCLLNPVGPNPETEKAGLENPSHQDPIILTDDGFCKVSFALLKVQTLTFCLKADNSNTVLNQIIQKTQKDKVEFNIRLPHSGSFVLQIFNDSTGYICNYLLVCSNPEVKWPPYPTSLHNPVGPTPETENFGLYHPSHPDPVICLEDGCCTISFKLNRALTLIASLKCDEIPKIPNHVLQSMQNQKVDFKVRLPKAGSYIFQIFDGSSCYICNYLLTCTNSNVKWPPYPSMLQNPVGPNPETEKEGLLQPSHPDPIIDAQDGCCTLTYLVKRELVFFCTLHSDEPKMISEAKHRHVFQTQKGEIVEFKVRLPHSGTYVLRINFKTKNSKVYTSQCNYLILSSNTSVQWPVFPLVYDNWNQSYVLVEPLDGILPKNSNVFFKLQVPDVEGLLVKGKSQVPLILSDQGYWEGTCSTDNCKELYVTLSYKHEPKSLVYILQYLVR